jgi:Delta3,5-Delta2,4-dienoyl-CoA isomerase
MFELSCYQPVGNAFQLVLTVYSFVSLLISLVKDPATSNIFSTSKSDPARTAHHLKEYIKGAQSCTDSIATCTKPFLPFSTNLMHRVICVLHGASVGIAIDISSACDIRIASQDVKLSIKEVDIGLAADLGTLQRFPRVVGNDSWTRELALSGRFFSANEALEKGFVSYVFESKDRAIEKAISIAKAISMKSPIAVQGTKTLLDYSRDHSVREGNDRKSERF